MDSRGTNSHGPSFSNGPGSHGWRLRELNAVQVTFWQLV
jgi:hypothetical protein